jgi:hypothetical protein
MKKIVLEPFSTIVLLIKREINIDKRVEFVQNY